MSPSEKDARRTYQCPNCHGGFPEPASDGLEGVKGCPWCGQKMDGSYEYHPRVVSHERDSEDRKHDGLLLRWLK